MQPRIFAIKVIGVLILYGVYYNGLFWWLRPSIFSDPILLVYLGLQYSTGLVDSLLRPVDTSAKEEGNFMIFLVLMFLINPFFLILGDLEHSFLYTARDAIVGVLGVLIYLFASLLLFAARYQLGKQATGTIVIVENHELVTSGIYRYIRHPIYAAAYLGLLGFWLVVQSWVIPVVTFVFYFAIFLPRMWHEENMLLEQFGEEYKQYMVSSKKLIPFLY